jgi:hypothetical protein
VWPDDAEQPPDIEASRQREDLSPTVSGVDSGWVQNSTFRSLQTV